MVAQAPMNSKTTLSGKMAKDVTKRSRNMQRTEKTLS